MNNNLSASKEKAQPIIIDVISSIKSELCNLSAAVEDTGIKTTIICGAVPEQESSGNKNLAASFLSDELIEIRNRLSDCANTLNRHNKRLQEYVG